MSLRGCDAVTTGAPKELLTQVFFQDWDCSPQDEPWEKWARAPSLEVPPAPERRGVEATFSL